MSRRAVIHLSFTLLLLEATGARIRAVDVLQGISKAPDEEPSLGLDGEPLGGADVEPVDVSQGTFHEGERSLPFTKGTKYACIEKSRSSGDFCLVDFTIGEKGFEGGYLRKEAWTFCRSKSYPHQLKVCGLKDKDDPKKVRVSYKSTKMHVPKSCFDELPESIELEARVSSEKCENMLKWPEEEQTYFGPDIEELEAACKCDNGEKPQMVGRACTCEPVPCGTDHTTGVGLDCKCASGFEGEITWDGSTPSGECTPAPCGIADATGDGPDCKCASGFQGEITWDGSTPSGECSPAKCNIDGAVGEGLDCKCLPGLSGEITWKGSSASGDCTVEAMALFTTDPDHTWDINEKKIKCCASSDPGKKARLQDISVDPATLPKDGQTTGMVGFRSDQQGCGYMFGDTYHNALGKKMDTKSCSVSIAELMAVSGSTFDTVAGLLNLEVAEVAEVAESSD